MDSKEILKRYCKAKYGNEIVIKTYDIQEIKQIIDFTQQLNIHSVSQQRELLIGLLTKLENGGGSAFIDKEQIVDDYLKAN